jgi:hypothetical protein
MSFDWQGARIQQGDLVPGDAYAVAQLGAQLRKTADMIKAQAAALRNLTDGDGWDADSGKAFVEKVGSTADLLQQAWGRYDEAAAALGATVRAAHPGDVMTWASGTEWASTLELAQVNGQDALRRGKDADAESASAQRQIDHADGCTTDGGPDTSPAAMRIHDQKSSADADVLAAGRDLQAAIDLRDRQGRAVADAIRHFIDHDGLKNPTHHWWDVDWKNLIADIGHVAGVIAGVAGILALCLSWVPIVGEVLGAIALVAGAVALVCDTISALDGKGNWFDVAIDVVGLLSCGAGRALGGLAKGARGLETFNGLRAAGTPLTEALSQAGLKAGDVLPFKAGGMKLFLNTLKNFGEGMSTGPFKDIAELGGKGVKWSPRLPGMHELGPNLGKGAGWKLHLGGWGNATFPLALGLTNLQIPSDFSSWEPGWMNVNLWKGGKIPGTGWLHPNDWNLTIPAWSK